MSNDVMNELARIESEKLFNYQTRRYSRNCKVGGNYVKKSFL